MILRISAIALTAAIMIYLVIVLGGYVKSTGAGLGCGSDWPTCSGYLIPPDLRNFPMALEFTHRVLALLSAISVVALTGTAWSQYGKSKQVTRWATLTAVLLAGQILIGMVVVKLELEAVPSTLHLALATATFGAATVTAVFSFKDEKLRSG